MKILITADWHIDKNLFSRSRFDEQKTALEGLKQIADSEGADVIAVAGDIYDSRMPSSDAVKLFTEAVVSFDRPFIAIAGNHDDGTRLAAPGGFAIKSNAVLCGGVDMSYLSTSAIRGRAGGVTVKIGGETLNVAMLPFPSETRLVEYFPDIVGETYADRVKFALNKVSEAFDSDGFNLLLTHLFLGGSESSAERTLGSALMLPSSVLPECDFAAVGHIHKPYRIADKAYYPGSIMRYSFDEGENKNVLILDTQSGDLRAVPISFGKKLFTFETSSFDEAAAYLSENDGYVKIKYSGAPLTRSQTEELKKSPSFCALEVERRTQESERTASVAGLSDVQLFEAFYKDKRGKDPSEEVKVAFEKLIAGDEDDTE